MNHKNGKWTKQILAHRHEDGMWGNFHALGCPINCSDYKTEQAIRRLHILGYKKEDEPIQGVINRMVLCIEGKENIDHYSEKIHDWPLFQGLMLSAWIRIFDPSNQAALAIAQQWAFVAEKAFEHGEYDRERDIAAFTQQRGRKPKSSFETGFGMFYHVALLKGVLSPKTESLFLDYCLARPDGMYYIHSKPLYQVPAVFASRESSRYLYALEVLAEYDLAKEKLQFAVDWLIANQDVHGQWDFGMAAKDNIYFPLSDSWRDIEVRKSDCTERVTAFLKKVGENKRK